MFSVSLDPENRKTEKIMRFTIPKTNCWKTYCMQIQLWSNLCLVWFLITFFLNFVCVEWKLNDKFQCNPRILHLKIQTSKWTKSAWFQTSIS
jgi:hypothetical protein